MSTVEHIFCDLCGKEIQQRKPRPIISYRDCPLWDYNRTIMTSLSVVGNDRGQLDRCERCELVLVDEYARSLEERIDEDIRRQKQDKTVE